MQALRDLICNDLAGEFRGAKPSRSEKSANGNVLVHVVPVNPYAPADEPPVGALLGRGAKKSWEPCQSIGGNLSDGKFALARRQKQHARHTHYPGRSAAGTPKPFASRQPRLNQWAQRSASLHDNARCVVISFCRNFFWSDCDQFFAVGGASSGTRYAPIDRNSVSLEFL